MIKTVRSGGYTVHPHGVILSPPSYADHRSYFFFFLGFPANLSGISGQIAALVVASSPIH